MQLFFCVLSGLVLVGGVSTQVILFLPKLIAMRPHKVEDGEFSESRLQKLSTFGTVSRRNTDHTGKKRAISVAHGGARPAAATATQLKRQEWDTLTLVTSVRIVKGRLSGFGAMWTPSAVTFLKDMETRRPTLSIMSTAADVDAGHCYDLSAANAEILLAAETGAGNSTTGHSKSNSESTSSGNSQFDAAAAGVAGRIIRIELASGIKIYMRVPSGPLADLWATVLNAGNSSSKLTSQQQRGSANGVASVTGGKPVTLARNPSNGNPVTSTRSMGAD
ncbi:hypothetical protein BC828DRAFT_391207 [Blastocladiella britannica]|nr:hypothetical protein BC828DRAFT_391207 [Blastocladiella britannica]